MPLEIGRLSAFGPPPGLGLEMNVETNGVGLGTVRAELFLPGDLTAREVQQVMIFGVTPKTKIKFTTPAPQAGVPIKVNANIVQGLGFLGRTSQTKTLKVTVTPPPPPPTGGL